MYLIKVILSIFIMIILSVASVFLLISENLKISHRLETSYNYEIFLL